MDRERGSAAGAVVFALVLAGVLVGGFLWLQGRREMLEVSLQNGGGSSTNGGAADKWTQVLGKFLAKGPDRGTWETRFFSCVYTHYLRPVPGSERDLFLIAEVTSEGPRNTRSVPRWLVPRHFFRAPASLFFSNYVRSRAPVREMLPDGTETWRVHWKPRSNFEGLVDTERHVWFSVDEGEVVQVEDVSRTGHMVRLVKRISRETGAWDVGDVDVREALDADPPDPHADPDLALAKVAAKAPFPVFVPTYLPPGFVLVRASYQDFETDAASGDGARVHLVTQLYSDGLGLISLAIAPRDDMNLIERQSETMMEDPGNQMPCPGLPAEPREIEESGSRIKLRTDSCRTVARRDDLVGASATLIGRNELPADEYLRMIGSLEPRPSER
jgi:hypothetical protein